MERHLFLPIPTLLISTCSGPSSPVPFNTSGDGYRMYGPSKNSPGRPAQIQKGAHQDQETASNNSRGLLRVRQPRGLGDGWPGPMGGGEGGNRISGSNTWTRAQLHTMEALIVTTPAMSGNGSCQKSGKVWNSPEKDFVIFLGHQSSQIVK